MCCCEMDKNALETNGPIQMGDPRDVKWAPDFYQISVGIYCHTPAEQERVLPADCRPLGLWLSPGLSNS